MSAENRAIDELGIFLPPATREILGRLVDRLESANLHVDELVGTLLAVGESWIAQGLDFTIQGSESLLARVYELGWMDALGDINPFLRDGAEIGLELALNTLKAMTPADVAKILGVIVVALAAPNLLLLNGAEFVDIASQLLTKLWNLP